MIKQSEKKASPCNMSLNSEKDRTCKEEENMYEYELDEPTKPTKEELEVTETKQRQNMIQLC